MIRGTKNENGPPRIFRLRLVFWVKAEKEAETLPPHLSSLTYSQISPGEYIYHPAPFTGNCYRLLFYQPYTPYVGTVLASLAGLAGIQEIFTDLLLPGTVFAYTAMA